MAKQVVEGNRNQVIFSAQNSPINYYNFPESRKPDPFLLPRDIEDFTGRHDYIKTLKEHLQKGETTAISAVNGMGGVGKSALAIHVAHKLKEQFPHAQLYVDLRGQSENCQSPKSVLIQFLRALTGQDESQFPLDIDGLKNEYRSVLAQKEALVVLDNARDKEQVKLLLPGSDTCGVLITSRQPLGSLPGAKVLKLEVMSSQEGLEYLKKQLGEQRVQENLEAAQNIVSLCGGLPLALAIAGGVLKEEATLLLGDYARELENEQQRLKKLKLDDLNVRASFNLSYIRLTEPEQQLFAVTAWLPGNDFGEAVTTAMMEWEEDTTRERLRRLVRVRVIDGQGQNRYKFHDLMRLFAREQLKQEEGEGYQTLALNWYCKTADVWNLALDPVQLRQFLQLLASEREELAEELEKTLPLKALDWFEQERGNWVDIAKQLHKTENWSQLLFLGLSLANFFKIRAHWNDGEKTYKLALNAAQQLCDRRGEGHILTNLGNVYQSQSRWKEAIKYHKQSLKIFRKLGDRRGKGYILTNLGNVYQSQSRWNEAMKYHKQSLKIFRKLGDRHGEGKTLTNLGNVYYSQSHWNEAIEYFRKSLEIKRKLGDRHGEGNSLTNLGNVYKSQGHWKEAIDCHEESLKIKTGTTLLSAISRVWKSLANWAIAIRKAKPSPTWAMFTNARNSGTTLLITIRRV